MRVNNALVRHLFQQESLENVEVEELDALLAKYPYLAHLHWLKAIKNKNDKTALLKAGLHSGYPGILNYYMAVPVKQDIQDIEVVEKSTLPVDKLLPEKPVLQPLYTEDYFAFTRTRLPEKIENDKPPTMEQVKSFTGWLRMMKKPQAAGMPEEDIEIADQAGEKSLKKEEVITESMADIWIRNGRPKEAIGIYNKLILLNPEKKGYFAAKIKALKEQ